MDFHLFTCLLVRLLTYLLEMIERLEFEELPDWFSAFNVCSSTCTSLKG